MGGAADTHTPVASHLLHLQTRTTFPNVSDVKYSVPYAKSFGSAHTAALAVAGNVSVAVIGRHFDPEFDSAVQRLELDLAGSGIEVNSFTSAGPLSTTPRSQAEADKALLERVAESVTTEHILLIDDPSAVSAAVIGSYAASVDASVPGVAVLNLTGAETDLYDFATAAEAPALSPSGAAGFDFDFEDEFDFDDAAGAQPSHQIVLNEMLKPGFAVAMETSRLRSFIPSMPSMTYPWLVAGMVREAYLDGLQLHRYGAISSATPDTWSPAGLTPIQVHEASSGNKLQGVTITIAAANAGRESLVATIDSLLLSENVALNISVHGLGRSESLAIADAYSATEIVRVGQGQPSAATTLVQMGVEAGIVFERQSLRKILDHAASLDYSVLRLITGQSDSKIEVWPTSLLATALRLAEDGNIDEFVVNHSREHWNSGTQFGLAVTSQPAVPAAR